jgi:hypothetical protein
MFSNNFLEGQDKKYMDDLTKSNADPEQDVMVEDPSIQDCMLDLNASAVNFSE